MVITHVFHTSPSRFTYPKELVITHVFHTSPSRFTYPKELSIHGHNTCILYIPIPLLVP